ncbi:WYL domain-containing protein [Desulfosporosinus fructosivorans]|uniref:WYL domain-containing protein n=1 Tax=Desulfosporosinus fructosivorans TaxID=2018669 RepID=A0A4Z0R5T7_9FIRM|nr:WYL domain-containing protein [Desulfosporosinus fructosivorans]TGE38402.1 WYL domain-containing protein [Desulfosporosinus fructosivorans]
MDSIERMGKILALIEAHPEGICGRALADGCGVPWGTMKQDLKVLVSTVENPIPLYTDRDEENNAFEEDLFLPEVKWFMATAQKCYTPVHLNVREGVGVLATLDFLQEDNSLKEGLRQKILSGFDLGEEETYRYIKGELAPLEPIQGKTFPIIENAIRTNQRLTIAFNGRKITVDPLGIVYYSRLRCWYLVARQGDTIKTYHLNKVLEVQETGESFVYPEGFSLKAWFGPRWGMEYGDLIRVKVRFLNRSQTVAKVHKDVAHRASELTTLEDGSLLFEDDIIGVNEFITWVLGFGSAAEIIEPVELRELILKRVRETLGNYQEEVY